MARAKGIRAGKAFVEIFGDDTRLRRTLKRVQARLNAFASTIGRIGAVTAIAFVPMVKAAGDAQETINRFRQVFGEQAEAAEEFAERTAKAVGRSKSPILDALSSFQGFFVGLGFGAERAREMSQEMQTLALDFASFNNLSDDEAVQRFISALSGSSEVLDRFGVNIKAAAIEQELANQGINKTTAQATEQEKAIARLSIIMRAMTDQGAVGDAVRTQGSFTNQLKRLKGELHDASVAIGEALLPQITTLVTNITRVVGNIADWIKANPALIEAIGKLVLALLSVAAAAKAVAVALTIVNALSGPAGWVNLGIAVTVAAGAMWGIDAALRSVSDSATEASQATDQLTDSQRRQTDATRGLAQGMREALARQRAWLSHAREFLVAASNVEQMNDEIREVARLSDVLRTNLPQLSAQINRAFAIRQLEIIDKFTGVVSSIRKVSDEIALLKGTATEAGLELRRMAEKGAPKALLARLEKLIGLRDRLKADEEAKQERERELSQLRSQAQQVQQQVATPGEAFKAEFSELKKLRETVDPKTGRALIDEETFERGIVQAAERARDALQRTLGAQARGLTSGRVTELVSLQSGEGLNRVLAAVQGVGGADPNQETAKNTAKQLDFFKVLISKSSEIVRELKLKPQVVGI